MCRGARQGVFVKDECVSWYSEVGVSLLSIEDRSEVKCCVLKQSSQSFSVNM